MAIKFETQSSYDVPPQRLLELITDPDFQRDRALALGAQAVSCSRHEETDGTVVLTLREQEPSRWGSGGHQSTLTLSWDLAAMASTWRRTIDGLSDRSRAEGTARIVAGDDAASCRLILDGEIEVRVPLIGRTIERKVVETIERQHQREEAFFRQRLGL